MNDEPLLWQAYEHEKRDNSSNWYWVVGIISSALIVICILLGNTLFGIVIGLSVGILMYYSRKEPRLIEVELGNLGVRIHDKIYPYETLTSFHVEKSRIPKLILRSNKMFMPLIVASLGESDPDTIHAYISQYLAEDFHPEPLTHKFLDYLGF